MIKQNTDIGYWLEKGCKACSDQRWQEAITSYTKAIDLNSDSAEAYYNRAIAHIKLDHDQQAIVDLSKAIDLKPDYTEAYFMRGGVYAALGNHPQAIGDAKLAAYFGNTSAQEFLKSCGIAWG